MLSEPIAVTQVVIVDAVGVVEYPKVDAGTLTVPAMRDGSRLHPTTA